MRICRLTTLLVLATLPLESGRNPVVAVPLPAQQADQRPGPPGTFRVRVRLIPVDVVVTDKNDRPVPDLKKEDFTILENGRPQEIRHFTVQTLSPEEQTQAGKVPAAPTRLRKVPTLDLTPRSNRTFLILLGRGRHQSPFRNIDELVNFVRRDLLPQDLVAVFAYNRATDFTTDHQRIVQVLERYKKIHEKIESKLEVRFSGLAAIYGNKAIPKSLQPEIDEIFNAQGGLASRQVPPGRITAQGRMSEDEKRVSETLQRVEVSDAMGDQGAGVDPFDQLEADMLTDLPFDQYAATSAMTNQDVQNIFTAIEYLRYMEGEKHLLFFTQKGLFLPRMEYDKGVAAMANDARVVIDTFHTGGVEMPLDSTFSASTSAMSARGLTALGMNRRTGVRSNAWALASLRTISELTGGRSSIIQDTDISLARLNEITRVEYLLGYYPANDAWDGKYRRISVKVDRPGLKVSFRHGYYARDSLQPYDRREFLAYSRISAAAGYGPELHDIAFKVAAVPQNSPEGQPQLRVDLQIDPSSVVFKTINDRHTGQVRVTIFYSDSKGRLLGEQWRTLDMNLREETYQRIIGSTIPISIPIPLQDPKQLIKVVVYDSGGDRVGSLLTRANAR